MRWRQPKGRGDQLRLLGGRRAPAVGISASRPDTIDLAVVVVIALDDATIDDAGRILDHHRLTRHLQIVETVTFPLPGVRCGQHREGALSVVAIFGSDRSHLTHRSKGFPPLSAALQRL